MLNTSEEVVIAQPYDTRKVFKASFYKLICLNYYSAFQLVRYLALEKSRR